MASQRVLRKLRQNHPAQSKQIGASFRDGSQVQSLAGIDVMTMPPKVAGQFKDLKLSPDKLTDMSVLDYKPIFNSDANIKSIRMDTLWDVPDELVTCCEALEQKYLDEFSSEDLAEFLSKNKCGDILPKWTDEQIKTSREEGKIPKLENWKDALADKKIGLDSLMNLAGLMSFTEDQAAMDKKVKEVLSK